MKFVTLNLRHGGGTRAQRLVNTLVRFDADVLVLTEFRDNKQGATLTEHLAEAGWRYHAHSSPDPKTNAVAVFSKAPILEIGVPVQAPDLRHRLLEVQVGDVTVGAVYFPQSQIKVRFWSEEYMPLARERVSRPYLFIGDFNTGKHLVDEAGKTFFGADYMDYMEHLGWVDGWRSLHPDERDFTWFSHKGNGFRVDHAWLSPPFASRLVSASHDHEPRLLGVTDHSALIVEIK